MDAVNIESFSEDNIERTFEWVSQEELQKLFTMREPPTWEKHGRYFEAVLADPSQRVYAIYKDGRHIGNCGLKNLDEVSGELWLYIGAAEDRGCGYGKQVCCQLLQQARALGLTRIYLHVLSANLPAKSLYSALGYTETAMESEARVEWQRRSLDVIRMEMEL